MGDLIEKVNGSAFMLPEEPLSYQHGQTLELSVYPARADQRREARLALREPVRPARPTGRLIGKKFGYLDLPHHSLSDSRQIDYADLAQKAIRTLDAQRPRGWVVDLRNNAGGCSTPCFWGWDRCLGKDMWVVW